jgi:WD40 repeat protein/serine/threonine protein kinase
MSEEHPKQFGDYRIVREIGRGGMGIVYEAEQVSLGRRVALKVLPAQHLDPLLRRRFEREAKAAARLHHTNIVPVFGVGTHDGQPYYVMQFIEGLGLDQVILELQRLRRQTPPAQAPRAARKDLSAADVARSLLTGDYPAERTPPAPASNPWEAATMAPGSNTAELPGQPTAGVRPPSSVAAALLSRQQTYWRRAAGLGVQVAAALGYAHKQGVLHRDVKPSNLLLDTRGTVWITDFGLAKAQDQQDLTQTGEILGTLRYMPPEAYEGKGDGRSDQYALGLTLYELLTLRPAFDAPDRLKLITQICGDEPPRPRSIDRRIPRDLETIVLKAMEKDPRRRYPTAEDMAEDLQRFIDNEPIKARPLRAHERLGRWCRRNPATAGLVVALAVVFLAGFAGVTWKWREAVWQEARTDEARKEALHERNAAVTQKEAADTAEQRARRLLYASDMNVALQAWEDGDLRRAQELLQRQWPAEGEEDLREFSWRYLWRLCQGDEIRTVPGAGGRVAYSPDGKTLAAVRGGTVEVCDAASGKLRATLTGPTAPVLAIAFSPDGKTLAGGGADKAVRLWDLEAPPGTKPRAPATLAGHTAAVTSLLFARDGKTLATAGRDKTIRLWDVAERREIASVAGFEALHFLGGGKTLAARGADETLLLWDTASRRPLPSLGLTLHEPVLGVAFSPDGKTLATGDTDRRVRLWDVATGKATDLAGHTAWVPGVTFSPDGKRLASCSHDGTAILWDVAARRPIVRLAAHQAQVLRVAFSPDGLLLATGSADATIKLWDTTTFQQVGLLRSATGYDGPLAFAPDGLTLVSGGKDGSAKLWPVLREGDQGVFARTTGWTSSLACSPDGKLVAAADSHDNSAKLWDTATRRLVARLGGKAGMMWQVAFAPDGKTLAAGGNGVRCWDVSKLPAVQTPQAEVDARVGGSGWGYLGFSAEGKWLAGGDLFDTANAAGNLWNAHLRPLPAPWWDNNPAVHYVALSRTSAQAAVFRPDRAIQLWDLAAECEVDQLNGQTGRVSAAAFSPSGKTLATGSSDGTVRLWGLAPAQILFVFAAHTATVHSVAFSPDGRTLATTSEDGTVKLWHTEIGQPVGTLKVHRGPVTCAAFSPDGNTLATTGADATVRFNQAAAPEAVRRPERPPGTAPTGIRADELARQGRWEEAARDLDEAVRANPSNTQLAINLAYVRLQVRDLDGYRQFCRQRAQELARNPLDSLTANNTAWLLSLGPEAVTDYAWAIALAEQATAEADNEQIRGIFLNTLGAILYRAGRYRDAVDRLDQRLAEARDEGLPQDWAFLALAHHRLGHGAEARRWLDKLCAHNPPKNTLNAQVFWNELEIALLRREAEELMVGDKP